MKKTLAGKPPCLVSSGVGGGVGGPGGTTLSTTSQNGKGDKVPRQTQMPAKQQSRREEVTVEELSLKPEEEQLDCAAIDELLEEIDGLLENNVQEFVDSYVQRGGQ